MDDQVEQPGQGRSGWNADATMDYPVGPDDAGNAVMHGLGSLIRGWRWLVGTITNRS